MVVIFIFRYRFPKLSKLRKEASPLAPRPGITVIRIQVLVSMCFFLFIWFGANPVTMLTESLRVVREFKDGSPPLSPAFLVKKQVG